MVHLDLAESHEVYDLFNVGEHLVRRRRAAVDGLQVLPRYRYKSHDISDNALDDRSAQCV